MPASYSEKAHTVQVSRRRFDVVLTSESTARVQLYLLYTYVRYKQETETDMIYVYSNKIHGRMMHVMLTFYSFQWRGGENSLGYTTHQC